MKSDSTRWMSNSSVPLGIKFAISPAMSLVLSATLTLVALPGCSDSSDRGSAEIPVSQPQYAPVVTPVDGSADVARTEWITLQFPEPLPTAAALTAMIDCDSRTLDFATDWLDGELLLINPKQELPANESCTLSWQHQNSTGSTSFQVASAGAPAVLAYDRDDDSTLTPFPDDVWLVEAEDTPTGYRLELPVPDRTPGIQTLYGSLLAATENLDGFSPVAPFVIPVPGPLDTSTVPTTPKQSLDPMATVGLYVAETGAEDLGERVPFYLLQRDEENADGSLAHNLVIFPTQLLNPKQRYVLVVTRRALIDVSRPLEPSPFFIAARDGELSNGTAAGQRVGALLNEVLPMLEEHASPPLYPDDIALAVRLTVRSIDTIPTDALSIRAQLQELPAPGYTITSVEHVTNPNSQVAAVVYGTWDVPSFRAGAFVARDLDGLPEYTEDVTIPFVLALPEATAFGPVPITMYQHGQPGSAEELVAGAARILHRRGLDNAFIGFTDIVNRDIIPDGGALTLPIFQALLVDKRMPEYLGTLILGEQLAFLRLISSLNDLDVFPIGAPDGVPDLDVGAPLTYLGISKGSNHGTRLVSYAPEIRAANLVASGGHWSGLEIHQSSDVIYQFAGGVFAGLTRSDLYLSLTFVQMGYDVQDSINHTRYLYREPHPLEVETRPSVLFTSGLADHLVPAHSTETAVWGFGIPHLQPVQRSVPSLEVVSGPVSANISADTTAAYYQYVPVGVEGVAPTPGCETYNYSSGHACAQPTATPEATDQTFEFFRSAIEGSAPTIIDPLSSD